MSYITGSVTRAAGSVALRSIGDFLGDGSALDRVIENVELTEIGTRLSEGTDATLEEAWLCLNGI